VRAEIFLLQPFDQLLLSRKKFANVVIVNDAPRNRNVALARRRYRTIRSRQPAIQPYISSAVFWAAAGES
jgi:hypothetical protein